METFWLWQLLGRFHPMVVHFPIGLLLFAGLLELIASKRFFSSYRPGIQALVWGGSCAAVLAAILGILMMNAENLSGSLMDKHQWLGISTALLSLAVLYLHQKAIHTSKQQVIKAYRFFLCFTCFGVVAAGHYGASMTYGEDFLTSVIEDKQQFDFVAFQNESLLGDDSALKLIGQVRMVLAHNCYKCHSGAKTEGKLRLDTKEFLFAGGENGEVVKAGFPEKSELIRRIKLPAHHKEAMPSKGKPLSQDEIALLSFWIEKGAVWPDDAEMPSLYRVAELAPRNPALPKALKGYEHPVDRWVNVYFEKNGISWKPVVDDRTYLRRVYLDVLGLLPDAAAYTAFANDPDPDKRLSWLKKLLEREDDFAQHWLTFWNDHLRNDYTGTGYITNGRYNITDWLYEALRSNMRYDEFVRQLLNPNDRAKGFIAGIQWRGTVNASQRTEMQAAQNVGQVFLGLNLKCASCHDSFISDWKLDQAYAFANVFADSVLEINRCDQPTGRLANTAVLWQELGDIDSLASRAEKLKQLSNAIVQPANGRLYRTFVNRIWKQLMGRGLVEPVDEMDNEPWSQDLLDWMASNLVTKGYDPKALIYLIASSKTYQQPVDVLTSADQLKREDYVFRGMVSRRLSAEQFADALSTLVSPLFEHQEMKYNPFQLRPEEQGRQQIVRASLVANNAFLTALGRPSREVVATVRDMQANLLQALELTNGARLNEVLERGSKRWWQAYPDPNGLIDALYGEFLLRKPNSKEVQVAKGVLSANYSPEKIQDLMWALVLQPEFQLIH
jgi:uncharacterized membrane protein